MSVHLVQCARQGHIYRVILLLDVAVDLSIDCRHRESGTLPRVLAPGKH